MPTFVYYLYKIDSKPRSTSKSADKSISLNFSKSYLAPSNAHRSTSGERIKPLSGKVKHNRSGNNHIPLLKIDKTGSHHTSKQGHFNSADRDLRKTKTPSKSKSYLISYLNQKSNAYKAESLGKLDKIRNQ